jgi:6-phosphofructo-2-kinase/fructose-2,6-biphosphatase
MPLEYSERQRNKLTWRYPRGESYMDVLHRLEPVIHELERQRRPVVVVAHRAVLRCLYGYLVGIDTKRVCFLPLPLHTVIKLTTSELGWKVSE